MDDLVNYANAHPSGVQPFGFYPTGYVYNGSNAQGFILGENPMAVPSSIPVPEPATWAMMIVGLAGLGVVLRSRRALATGPGKPHSRLAA